MRANNIDQIYSMILWSLYTSPDSVIDSIITTDKERSSGYRELNGYQFKLTNIEECIITHNKARNFNLDYAKAFFTYVMTGELGDITKNPKAEAYLVEFEGRNTQYGPRISSQLPNMIAELKRDKDSRRGTLLILDKGDQELFSAKMEGRTSIEYPCTNSLTFSIRNNELHLVSNMRSQSACMVMLYDVYNWCSLIKYVHSILKDTYPGLTCGTLTHQVASLHYLTNEEDLVKSILTEYGMLV